LLFLFFNPQQIKSFTTFVSIKKNRHLLYPVHIEQKIGFDKIRELLRSYCLGQLGINEVDAIAFSTSQQNILEMLEQTKECKHVLQFEDSFPENSYADLTQCLDRIRIEGTWIQLQELVELRKTIIVISAIVGFFKSREEGLYPRLTELAGNVTIHKLLVDRIDAILDRNGRIKDNATPELAYIRRSIGMKRSEVSKIMQRLLKEAKNEGWADSETEISLRDGRLVIPINASSKRKLKGFIHDESATGKTSFIEPAEAFEKNNEITELEFEEHREIIKILMAFTDFVRPYREELLKSQQFLGTIDFLMAKSKLAIELDAVAPVMVNTEMVRFAYARHPLLYLSHKKEGKTVVAQYMDLDVKQRILLISGPNAGGKSVCLKMVAMLQYMVQCGLLIPVSEKTECGIFANIFIDIGDEQSIENDLSTYSSHLKNMKYFLDHADAKTLFLIDEFGAGTEPLLGGAIAEAILEDLNKKGSYGIINSHYTNLKHFASETEGLVNGAMLYDNENMKPLFKLQIGAPGSSFAFEIAENMGLPKAIIQKASEKIGQQHIDFDRSLKEVERDKQFVARKKQEIDEKEAHLRDVLNRYNTKMEDVTRKKKEILDQAHSEAKTLLKNTNKVIENTIRQIKETNAEKESTRIARQELEEFKIKTEEVRLSDEERINRKIEQIKQKQDRRQNKTTKPNPVLDKAPSKKVELLDSAIAVGDKVQMKGQQAFGEVLELDNKNAIIAFGTIRSRTLIEKLQKVSNATFKNATHSDKPSSTQKTNFDLMEKRLHFSSEIDVRGKRSNEAIPLVMEFVEQAIVLGITHIQILHGKGDGILRSQIRTFLQTVDVITSFSDAPLEMGGSGITIIEIE
jgi:DNA mismatch repair protein MutS2